MDRKKVIYIGLVLILTVIVSITYFSYAFFTSKAEQRGKLNIVTGTLDYKIESDDLTNNSITLSANSLAQTEIKITSLNSITSKYELYYTTTSNNIEIGYGSSNDTPIGTITANSTKTISIVIKNKSASSVTVTFGIEGGFTNNTLVLSTGNSITEIIDTVVVTLDPGDGTVSNNNLVLLKNSAIGTIETPTNGSYIFDGWYLEDTFQTKVTTSTVFNNDTTLYAKWISEIYLYNTGTISNLIGSFTTKTGNGKSGSDCINSVSYRSSYIRLQSGSGGQNNCGVGIASNNKINLSGYNKLCVTFTHSNANCNLPYGAFQFGIASTQTTSYLNGITDWTGLIDSTGAECLDISSYNDSYYLILHNYYTGYSDVTAVYLTN